MSWPTRIWILLAALYALFFSWYTSFGGPLSDEEIAHYSEVLESANTPPERLAVFVEFMRSDTGDDFAMFNAIDMRERPLAGPGIDPQDSSDDVMAKYTTPFMGQAFLAAAHPVVLGSAGASALDLWGIEGASEWDVGGLVRYRSRRDLMEQALFIRALDPNIHDFKIAAIEKTIAYPLDPWFQLGDPRLLLALTFVIIGLSSQLLFRRDGFSKKS